MIKNKIIYVAVILILIIVSFFGYKLIRKMIIINNNSNNNFNNNITNPIMVPNKPVLGQNSRRRFAIDHFSPRPEHFNLIKSLDGMLLEWGGGAITVWGAIEPKPPINGVSNYLGLNNLDERQKQFFNSFVQSGFRLSAHVEFLRNNWALEQSNDVMVVSPETGERFPGFIRIKPEYHKTWQNFIKYYLTTFPNIDYLQIDNEPENVWVNSEGYVEAVRLAYEAVGEYNSENNRNVKLKVAGFALSPDILSIREDIKMYVYENHPNIDFNYIRKELKIPQSIDNRQIFHTSQKIHMVMSILLLNNPPFDIVTIHNDWSQDYDEAKVVLSWYKNLMNKSGYERPIYIDDMHTGYYPKVTFNPTPEDQKIYSGLRDGNQNIINQYIKAHSAWLVRKSVFNFAAGAEMVQLAPFFDVPNYHMPTWRYVGLFTTDLKPKPSFYTAKLLMNKIDYFETVKRIKDDIYKFTFKDKGDVYVAWNDSGNTTIDLTSEFGNANVKITFLINEVDSKHNPIIRESIVMPTNRIPLTKEPVFIEKY